LLWGGFFRVTFVHHMTFFVNSLTHMFGTQPYSTQDTSRDNWWVAFLTCGEGYHNFHHRFQADYRNGFRWFQFDSSKWFIAICEKLHLASGLNRTPVTAIAYAISTAKGSSRSGRKQSATEPFQKLNRL